MIEVHPGLVAATLAELLKRRTKAEHRSAHLALPPAPKRMSAAELEARFAEMHRRVDELEAGATS